MSEKENQLTRKFGLPMAICAIVGVVIGSGIYFRNEDVVRAVQGNLMLGILAWLVGGVIMLSFAYCFAKLATRHEKMNGAVDFGEAMVGKKYGYFLGWYMGLAYIPAITAVMAWVSARFTVILFGWDVNPVTSGQTFMLAGFYLIAINVMNMLSHKISAKFHISATVIKLVPLILMGVVGTIIGLINGITVGNVGSSIAGVAVENPFMTALVATAFAYDGWWVVASLNSEVRNSRRNLPIAMIVGGIMIIGIYLLYFIGIFSSSSIDDLAGQAGVLGAFQSIFSNIAGTLLFVFIVISCLGTLNGVVMAGQRSMYSLSLRNRGPDPELFSQVDKKTNNPHNSSAIAMLISASVLVLLGGNFMGWYGTNIDIPGLASIFFWAMLIPIFVAMIFKQKDLNWFDRFVAPVIAIAGAIFMVYASIDAQRMNVLWFALATLVIIGFGALFLIKNHKSQNKVVGQTVE